MAVSSIPPKICILHSAFRIPSAFLREEGGPRSGGRSLRCVIVLLALRHRVLPQSRICSTAPSRREPLQHTASKRLPVAKSYKNCQKYKKSHFCANLTYVIGLTRPKNQHFLYILPICAPQKPQIEGISRDFCTKQVTIIYKSGTKIYASSKKCDIMILDYGITMP